MTLYEIVEDLLGQAPNDLIMNLYYVLCIVIVSFFMKVVLNVKN